ncbi:MAG TPA: hypothetical protein VN041_02630 [Microbacterium sp.]|nr:hypothetical protein [Microbacterium sp.]
MFSAARFTGTVASLVLAVTALAGCTAASEPAASAPSEKPAAVKTPAGEKPSAPTPIVSTPAPWDPKPPANGCAAEARIATVQNGKDVSGYTEGDGPITFRLEGEPVDRGPRKFAEGTVTLDSAGKVYSYTVAPGDVELTIGDRLCIKSRDFFGYNDILPQNQPYDPSLTIQPGDVLILQVDPTLEWTPPAA